MYVYLFLDEKNEPFYVGRTAHLSRTRKLRRNADCNAEIDDMLENGFTPRVVVINCDSVEETLVMESFLIKDIGRRDLGTGNLTNWSDGGEYPTEFSDAARSRMSKKAKARGFGGTRGWKPETWEKVRLSQLGNKKGAGRILSEQERAAITERNLGNQYAKGIQYTEFQTAKSEALTGRELSSEWRAKIGAAHAGSHQSESQVKNRQIAIKKNRILRLRDIEIPSSKEQRQGRRFRELGQPVPENVQLYWREFDAVVLD